MSLRLNDVSNPAQARVTSHSPLQRGPQHKTDDAARCEDIGDLAELVKGSDGRETGVGQREVLQH